VELTDADYKIIWDTLPANAREVLMQLCKHGPTYDGDLVSKSGRDTLLDTNLAVKMVMGDDWSYTRRDLNLKRPQCEEGYQAATYRGLRVYKYGHVERSW
jgi:hypothetical protein